MNKYRHLVVLAVAATLVFTYFSGSGVLSQDRPVRPPLSTADPAITLSPDRLLTRPDLVLRVGKGAGIHGTVFYAPSEVEPAPGTTLAPDIQIDLVRASDRKVVASVRTDAYGRYYFPKQAPGQYLLTWKAQRGWAAGRYRDAISVVSNLVNPDRIGLVAQKGHMPVFGSVKDANGSTAAFMSEYFGVISSPQVAAVAAPGNAAVTDYSGRFGLSLPVLPAVQNSSVSAVVDGFGGDASLQVNQAGFAQATVTLRNRRPVLGGVVVKGSDGLVTRNVVPGDKVTIALDAVDPDGDKLSFQWKGGIADQLEIDGGVAVWEAPKRAGVVQVHVLVSDGKGGYAQRTINIKVGAKAEVISGTVVEAQSKAPIGGAAVTVNGKQTQTKANGFFSINAEFADRYVVTIEKPGFTIASKTFQGSSVGQTWKLVTVLQVSIDPSKDFTLRDERKDLARRKLRPGVIRVGRGTLVDAEGTAPGGQIVAEIATLDIGSDEAPGDFAARDGDREVGLISYGMLHARFVDAQGNPLNLRKGATAEVLIPVPGGDAALESAPKEIPIWFFDDKDGYWKPYKTGNAQLDRDRRAYVGSIDHFSTVNMDQPGPVTCIRVLADPSIVSQTIRVSDVPGNGIDYATVKTVVLDKPVNAIYRIPPSQQVQIEALDGADAGDPPRTDVSFEVFDSTQPGLGWVEQANGIIDAGAAEAALWPPYPYSECPVTVLIRATDASSGAGFPPPPFFSFKGVGSDASAGDYYGVVDANNDRDTLEAWFARNGFDNNGVPTNSTAEYYRTSYTNDNDLGSGRDMHFIVRDDGAIATYVSNYGLFNQAHGNADLAASQNNNGNVVATVCMEFSPLEDSTGALIALDGTPLGANPTPAEFLAASVVKFFVFADLDGLAGTEQQRAADLDGYGPKFVPNLCLNCHGGSAAGSFQDPADADIQAYLRELDYKTYLFPAGASTPSAAEQAAFRGQNKLVWGDGGSSRISSTAIKELIALWYPDIGDANPSSPDILQEEVTPPLWEAAAITAADPALTFNVGKDPSDLYEHIVGKQCRTCHIAFGGVGASLPSEITFNRYDQFLSRRATIGGFVSSGYMPHAAVTWRNFWLQEVDGTSQTRPEYLGAYQDNNWSALGDLTTP